MGNNFLKQMMDTGPEMTAKEKGIIKAIEDGYMVGKGPKQMQKKSFAPGTLAYGYGECPRYWYLAFEGGVFESDVDAYAVANMGSGTDAHARIQAAMAQSGILVDTERKVINDDPPIFGYCDANIIVDDPENNNEIPVEIKTMREESFAYRKQHGKPPTYHVIQLLIYMKILKKSRGIFLYENKNSHELLVIPLEITPEYKGWMDRTFNWMRKVRKTWEDKTLPEKNYRSNSKICKGCPLKLVCDEAGKGAIKIPSLEKLELTSV